MPIYLFGLFFTDTGHPLGICLQARKWLTQDGLFSVCSPKPSSSGCVLSHVYLFATPGLWPSRLLCPWDSPGKNTGVSCHFLPQRIFPTQGSNLCLLPCRRILYHWATRETWALLGWYFCSWNCKIELCGSFALKTCVWFEKSRLWKNGCCLQNAGCFSWYVCETVYEQISQALVLVKLSVDGNK